MQRKGAERVESNGEVLLFLADLDEVFFFPPLIQSMRQHRRVGGG
jgi:hypothetical protein